MPIPKQYTPGAMFGSVTIINEVSPNVTPCGTKQRKFLCRCVCGKEYVTLLSTLKTSRNPNCGCSMSREIGNGRKYTDEQRNSWLYSTWTGMKQRCYDKKADSYQYYGNRGIKICDEWLNDYVSFYNWAITHGANKNLTIDRIDVNGDYCPQNCRWATTSEQSRNHRNNRYIEYKGERKLLIEWSEICHIPYDVIRARLDKDNWAIGEALGFDKHIEKPHNRVHTRKPVVQYTTQGEIVKEWNSLNDIKKELGFSISTIRSNCSGETQTAHGFIWRYKNEKKLSDKQAKKQIPILQYSLNGELLAEYTSVSAACKSTGVNANAIRKVCKHLFNKPCSGFLWKYKCDSRILDPVAEREYIYQTRITYKGETKSIREWANLSPLTESTIISRLRQGCDIGKALGLEFKSRKGSSYTCPILQLDANRQVIREWRSLHFIRKEGVRDKNQVRKSIQSGLPDSHNEYWILKDDYYAN